MEIESGEEHHTKAMTTRQGPGTGVLGQATTGNPPTEAVQDDDDGDILALSEKRSGKKRGDLSSTAAATAIQGKSASRISTPASSVPESRAPVSVARSSVLSKKSSSDSDSDSPSRPNKRTRTKGQDRDDDDDSDDGAKRGELRWRGTKQPVKRVARRF